MEGAFLSLTVSTPLFSRDFAHLTDRVALLQSLPRQSVGAEVGVDEGHFSALILEHVKPSKLYLIDQWGCQRFGPEKYQAVRKRFSESIAVDHVEIRRGDSYREMSCFPNAHLDWVYIDSDHSYETTKCELEMARLKVKAEGIIAGHDYVEGNHKTGLRYGVIEAVREFCLTYDWEIRMLTSEKHGYLSYALRKIGSRALRRTWRERLEGLSAVLPMPPRLRRVLWS